MNTLVPTVTRKRLFRATGSLATLPLLALAATLFAAAPASAGHDAFRGGISIRIGDGRVNDTCRRQSECDAAAYEAGQRRGQRDGYREGYDDGRHGRACCNAISICLDGHSRAFVDGYRNGYECAYSSGFRAGERERAACCERPRRHSRLW
jgi:hypothetical protein